MRTTPVLGVILALGFSFALIAGSGIGPAVFGENPGDSQTKKTLEEIGKDADVGCDNPDGDCEDGEGGVSADVGGDNEPTLVGFAISGGQFITKAVGAVAFLPSTLMGLGFPDYFANPAGRLAQIAATIGLLQFVRTGVLD